MDDRTRALIAAAVDAGLVVLFTLIGRTSHGEGQGGALVTVLPFLAGLAAGWTLARAWRAPFAVLRAGVPAWLGAVAVGMLLRAATGKGVQLAFVVVATIVLGGFLLGWRALLVAVDRSSTRGGQTPGPVGFFLRRR